MKPSVRQVILLFYMGATAFVALVAALAIYLHDQSAQTIGEPDDRGEANLAQTSSLQRVTPSSVAFALFAPSPAAAFEAWGTCAKGLEGRDTANVWLRGTFGDGETLAGVLARYRVNSDAPMAVFLEVQPVDRQFETHFAVVLSCVDPEGFIKSAWPIDPAASAAPRLLSERRGYTLALHGSLVCASWPNWIAISDSMSLASAVAESFLRDERAVNTAALGENTAVAYLFPDRLRSAWSPVTAWLRVAWPPLSPRLAALCDALQPAISDPGPIMLCARVRGEGMEAIASWSTDDCPGMSALLGEPLQDAGRIQIQNSDASLSGAIVLKGAIGSAVKAQLRHLSTATRDADTVEAIARITGHMSTQTVFELGPVGEEKTPIRIAWCSDNTKDTIDALAGILPVVQGAESATDSGASIYAARVVWPVYFAAENELVALASDANDVRQLLSASQQQSGTQHGAQRAFMRIRGAYLAQLLEKDGLHSSLGFQEEWLLALSHVAEGTLSWEVAGAMESVTLRIVFAAQD